MSFYVQESKPLQIRPVENTQKMTKRDLMKMILND